MSADHLVGIFAAIAAREQKQQGAEANRELLFLEQLPQRLNARGGENTRDR